MIPGFVKTRYPPPFLNPTQLAWECYFEGSPTTSLVPRINVCPEYRADGISRVKGSVFFAWKFALPPFPLSGVQISKQTFDSIIISTPVQSKAEMPFIVLSKVIYHGNL